VVLEILFIAVNLIHSVITEKGYGYGGMYGSRGAKYGGR
jgi:hypothetical protein